jgi:hypothetical protein
MSAPLADISQDLLLCDNLDSVTLKVTGDADVVLADCVLSEPTTVRELDPSGGQILRKATLFVWPVDQSDQPPLGAQILDSDGAYWTILQLERKQHVETWEATCVNLSVEAGLDNVATVLRANSYTKNSAGEAVPTWTEIATGIPARWQPLQEEAQIFEDADFTKTTYRVTFGTAPIDTPRELAGGDYRLVDKDGNHYRVTEYIQEERIDRLPVAICVKILEGAEYYGEPASGI